MYYIHNNLWINWITLQSTSCKIAAEQEVNLIINGFQTGDGKAIVFWNDLPQDKQISIQTFKVSC